MGGGLRWVRPHGCSPARPHGLPCSLGHPQRCPISADLLIKGGPITALDKAVSQFGNRAQGSEAKAAASCGDGLGQIQRFLRQGFEEIVCRTRVIPRLLTKASPVGLTLGQGPR